MLWLKKPKRLQHLAALTRKVSVEAEKWIRSIIRGSLSFRIKRIATQRYRIQTSSLCLCLPVINCEPWLTNALDRPPCNTILYADILLESLC